MARVTGLEPAAFRVTGGRSNQLSYTRALVVDEFLWLLAPLVNCKVSFFVIFCQ